LEICFIYENMIITVLICCFDFLKILEINLNQIEAKMQNLRKNKENIKIKGREKGKKIEKGPGKLSGPIQKSARGPPGNPELVRALLSPSLTCRPHLLGPRHYLPPPSEILAGDRAPPLISPL
jgi:hypothetical protein